MRLSFRFPCFLPKAYRPEEDYANILKYAHSSAFCASRKGRLRAAAYPFSPVIHSARTD